MLAASFETSEPEMFIAIPRSAFLSAGESFTPSPVLFETSKFERILKHSAGTVTYTPTT